MAALLSSVVDKTDDVVKYIAECRELGRYVPGYPDGVRVLPPSISESGWKFTPVSESEVRFGLGAVRGLGEGAVRSILDARAEGAFTSLFDLAERIDLRSAGKKALEALILSGACDAFGHRAQLLAALEMVVREAQLRKEERESGQGSLFDLGGASPDAPASRPEPQLPEVEPWPEGERLKREKEILGFFISGHPLEKFRDELAVFDHVNTSNLKEHRDQKVELACVVTSVVRQYSKKNGNEWARVTVEDFYGTATILAFGEAWEANKDRLIQDAAVLLRGEVSGKERDEEAPPVFLREVVALGQVRSLGSLALEVRLDGAQGLTPDAIERASEAVRSHEGGAPIFLRWSGTDGNGNGNGGERAHRFRSRSLQVDLSPALLASLRDLFGSERVRMVRSGRDA